jgi:hypothetical protein
VDGIALVLGQSVPAKVGFLRDVFGVCHRTEQTVRDVDQQRPIHCTIHSVDRDIGHLPAPFVPGTRVAMACERLVTERRRLLQWAVNTASLAME